MKFKPKLSALLVALAMTSVTLAGCNKTSNNGSSSADSGSTSAQTEKFVVNIAANEEYTISGLDSEGYVEGATVNFAVTLAHPEDKAINQVTAAAGTTAVAVTAGENGYSFTMPAHDVNVTIALKNIDKYTLSYTGTANADETITLDLKLGNAPVAADFTIEGKTDADKAKIAVDGDKVMLKEAGDVTVVAKIGNEVKAELTITVGQSAIMSIQSALDAAIAEAPCNKKTGKNAAMSTAKTIAGKVLALASYNNGAVQAIIDDGTAAVVVQLARGETEADPVEIGDEIRVTTVFTNYFGLLEGISKDASTGGNANNIPKTDIIKVNKGFTPSLAAAEDMTAAQYDAYYEVCAANGADAPAEAADTRTWSKIKYVNINVTFDKVGDDGSILYNIDDSEKAIDVKSSHDEGESLDQVAGHKSTLTGFLLGVNSSKNKSNMIVTGQSGLAVESVEISEGESVSMFKNNDKQLTYTTLPAGSYGDETWESSNPAILTVENGIVHSLAQGEADVTLTINGHSDSIHVVVSGDEIPATAVELDQDSAILYMDKTLTLTATTTPEVVTDQAQWTSDNEAAATVADGVVTPVAPGEATITVTYRQGVSASCVVTVKPRHGSVVEDPLTIDEVKEIGLTLVGSGGSSVYTEESYYVKGYVTSITPNSGAFLGTVENMTMRYLRYDTDNGVKEADLELGSTLLMYGEICNYSNGTIQLSHSNDHPVFIKNIDNTVARFVKSSEASVDISVGGADANNPFVVYPASLNAVAQLASDNAEVATIVDGKIHAVAEGSAVITATYGTLSANVTVSVYPQGVTVAKATMSYSGSSSTNMSASSNNAATVGLDASIFTVSSAKNKASNEVGLNKDGTIRLYANASTGNGTSLTVSVGEGKTIKSVVFNVAAGTATGLGDAEVKAGSNVVTGNEGFYVINASSFSIKNVAEVNKQIWFDSIVITYVNAQ